MMIRTLEMLPIILLLGFANTVIGELSLGTFEEAKSDVSGEVVLVSERVLEVRGFTYNGKAPDAFFWADINPIASNDGGFRLLQASQNCSDDILEFANGTETIVLEFPADGTSISDIQGGSISVWCRTMSVNLGHVDIPSEGLDGSVLLFGEEADGLLQCAHVEEAGLLERAVDTVVTWWNIVRWLPTRLFQGEE